MLPIIKEVKQKTRNQKGFTLVELVVVLVILAILAALAGAGLIAYTRLARFEHNESNARTVFQAAQIALTRKDTSGDMDDFLTQLTENGTRNGHFTADGLQAQYGADAEDKAKELNSRIVALYYDKSAPDTAASQLVYGLIGPYLYDESIFNASITLEIDSLTGQIYSAFYDTASDKMRFSADGDTTGATIIDDRTYDHRRNDSLVGYYSAEDTVNVVTLSQTRLKVKNPQLINNETLTLNWSSNSQHNDLDTIYDVVLYKTNNGNTENGKPLYKLEVEWSKVAGTDQNAPVNVYKYDTAKDGWEDTPTVYYFPLNYSKGRFILTLDAMCDATLLRAAENDPTSARTTLFSITRLIDKPTDIYAGIKARPNDKFEDAYTESKEATSNTENTLFASTDENGVTTLKYFRHLYNLRWVDSGKYTFNTGSLLAADATTALDWTDGSVTVYCADTKTASGIAEPVAKVPSRTGEVVAWPTIPALGENVTLTGSLNSTKTGGGHVIISNLQLRGTSVAAQERNNAAEYLKRDHYIGLIGENNGTLSKITLRDPDVQVNAEVVARGEQTADAMPINAENTQYLQALAENNTAYRQQIYAVGALAGVDTGTVTDCTVDRSNRRGAEAKVAAALTFSSLTTSTDRQDGTNIQDEPHGIGGLVGFAMPESGATLSDLTLDENVTVAGLFADSDAAKNAGTNTDTSADAAEKTRYNAIASGDTSNTLWRAVGVGGVAGVLDVTNLTDATGTVSLTGITNQATVVGNAFAGGIAGNLYATGATPATLTKLTNEGTVLAGANYQGGTAQKSTVLGQFFGGIAGYASNLKLDNCTSATRSGLSTTTLATLVQAGYDADGALNESSPLKGDFVGGLVGFGRDIAMTGCRTVSGYVLGRSFVGGFVGGFVGSNLQTSGGENNSYVFGNRYVGGIVSVNGKNSTIKNMTNKGLVAGLGEGAAYVGGIAGVNDATWGLQKNDDLTEETTAVLLNSANSMSTVEATDKNRIALLQQLSQTPDGKEHYADFVGGVAGYNGTNGKIHWTADSANGATLGAVLYGNNFVGGVAGYNDAAATIINEHDTIPNVTGTIVATGDCVGGIIGLNGAAKLPAVQVSANKIEGVRFVGGVIGANLPQNGFEFDDANGTAPPASTSGSGSLRADGVAGGIIGYNRVVPTNTLQSALADTAVTVADALRGLLPTFNKNTHALTEDDLTSANTEVKLTGLSNEFNINANAYVGGIIGYNSAGTKLTLVEARNGKPNALASCGGFDRSAPASAANGNAYIFYEGVSLGELDPAHNGYFVGGIIGYATKNTTLQDCDSYGIMQKHPVAVGGLAGVNDGAISGGCMYNSVGSQGDNYRYLGGIAGINNGTITNAGPADKPISGGVNIGGVAGYNSQGAAITLTEARGTVYGVTATGGVAGYNLGTIVANSVSVQVSGTSQTGGVAGFNGAGGTIGIDPNASGSYAMTIETGTKVSSAANGGGVAGRNEGLIQYITNKAGSIQATNQYAGGIAGSNNGRIYACSHNATGSQALYTGGGYAGGITGCNEAGGTLQNDTVMGSVTAANGEAGGITAHNYGTITTPFVDNSDIRGTSDAIGGVAACNEPGALIKDTNLLNRNGTVRLYGPATKVGGIVGYNAGTVKTAKVENNVLDLSGLTATANTVTAGGAVGENVGTVGGENETDAVTVKTDLTQNMDKYLNLGGVAGSNSGALVQCTYQGIIGNGSGMATVGSTVGGIVGSNEANGTVQSCTVNHITLHVQGASNVGASQDAATKMANAAHIGGIVGRNGGTVRGSTIATDDTRSTITARHGFVGGVAGSNSGSIATSGGKDTQTLVNKINDWLTVPYKKDANGNPTTEVNTAAQNANLNAMVRVLTNATYTEGVGSKPQATQSDEETALVTKFKALQGVDEISTGRTENQLKITLQGGTKKDDFANGYLGGITGFNDVTGKITNSASGQWFVYANNINQSWGAVGGIIGQNESNADSTSGLVNFAAVRRFVRGVYNTDDDDANNKSEFDRNRWQWIDHSNDRYTTKEEDTQADNYVGGVIGTQQNRTGDLWTLKNCVNLGTVFNSRSNNAGGVLAYWLGYGGTLDNCFNFGTIATNSNNGKDSGTVGGVAGYFNSPVAGTAVNLYKCRNYGSVRIVTNGANDVGGIFGKVQMQKKDDAMTINIVECVTGSNVKLSANSMAVGIFSYIGPYEVIPNVEVNIDRCRNYCYNLDCSNITAGIFGNRGDPYNSAWGMKKTTITNCFTLVGDYSGGVRRAVTFSDVSDAVIGSNNYYMDKYSFWQTSGGWGIEGLTQLNRTDPAINNNFWGALYGNDDKENAWIQARRLWAGKDNAANTTEDTYTDEKGNVLSNSHVYFGARLRGPETKTTTLDYTVDRWNIKSDNVKIRLESEANGHWYDPASKRLLTNKFYKDGDGNTSQNYAGEILLLFDESGDNTYASMADITDEALQNYYTYLLDTARPSAPQNLKVTKSDDTKNVYGRYTITWDKPATGDPTYYKLRVYAVNDDGTEGETLIDWSDVYEKRFTFEGKEEWTGSFNVEVKGVNTKGDGAAAHLIEPANFYKTLPTPDLEVRLVKNSDNSFSQVLVLKNADTYNALMQNADGTPGLQNWTVTARTYSGTTQTGSDYTFTDANYSPRVLSPNSLGSHQILRAQATSSDNDYMRSAQYDETVYVPTVDAKSVSTGTSGNPGLAEGGLTDTSASAVSVTGRTIDDLTFTTTLSFKPTVSGVLPTYRVMLMGRYIGADRIGGEGTSGAALYGQYITLAAREQAVPNSSTTFSFSNLPVNTLTDYDSWVVVAVPVNSGLGDVVTRWDATIEEAVDAIGIGGSNRPAAWYSGMEIIRQSDGSYTYSHLTPLYFANKDATADNTWAECANSNKQILYYTSTIRVERAPKLMEEATYLLNDDNQLVYTFTWQQPDEVATDGGRTHYKLTLYGVNESTDANGTVHTTEETIALPADASSQVKYDKDTKTYSYTLNVDKDLATDADQTNGSNSWRFDQVRLRVTRDTTNAGSNVIGAADSATYTVLRRLRQPGQPGQFIYSDTTNAEQTRYQISWPAVADERVDHYELWARVQNADGSLGAAEELHPYDGSTITGTQATVDLEKYQGQTLVFYVVACPTDSSTVLRSPNGEASEPQTIITRTDAPKINGVTFTWPGKETEAALPLMNTFTQNLTIQMDVGDSAGTSYYFTGYLFSDADAYQNACKLAKDWMDDSINKDKLDALNAALGKATLMIPNAYRTVGAETQSSGGTVAYTVTPSADGFTMRPDDANRYLLPALRTMVSSGAQTSSRWTFYVPENVQNNALHLPKIELDKPEKDGVNSLTAVTSTVKGDLYERDDVLWNPASDNITIKQFAVQWPAVNEYTQDGVTRNFATTYQFHVTPGEDMPDDDPNETGYDIRFTVAPEDVTETDSEGNEVVTTHRGQILNVQKLPNGESDWIDITEAAGIKDADGNILGYDLSIAEVEVDQPVYNEQGEQTGTETVKVKMSQPVTLTGHHEMNGDNPIYRIAAVPTLREANMSDGSIGYLVTLPDMTQPAESDNNSTAVQKRFTDAIEIWAVGDGEKTDDSEHLTVNLYTDDQSTQEDGAPVVLAMLDADTQPVQSDETTANAAPTTPADDAGAGEGIATPETAAPAA